MSRSPANGWPEVREETAVMSNRVCDCPGPCACYVEGYAQGKEKALLEMANSTGQATPRAVPVSPATPSASSWSGCWTIWPPARTRQARLVSFHFTSRLTGDA